MTALVKSFKASQSFARGPADARIGLWPGNPGAAWPP